MAKNVENWRLFIKTTANEQEEQRRIKAICNCLNGGTLEPDFRITLVGYNAEWDNVIETSSIVQASSANGTIQFRTYSGSLYSAKISDFQGIFCRTVNGEMRID